MTFYLMENYTNSYFDNIGPGNTLLPDGTKPLPVPMLPYH